MSTNPWDLFERYRTGQVRPPTGQPDPNDPAAIFDQQWQQLRSAAAAPVPEPGPEPEDPGMLQRAIQATMAKIAAIKQERVEKQQRQEMARQYMSELLAQGAQASADAGYPVPGSVLPQSEGVLGPSPMDQLAQLAERASHAFPVIGLPDMARDLGGQVGASIDALQNQPTVDRMMAAPDAARVPTQEAPFLPPTASIGPAPGAAQTPMELLGEEHQRQVEESVQELPPWERFAAEFSSAIASGATPGLTAAAARLSVDDEEREAAERLRAAPGGTAGAAAGLLLPVLVDVLGTKSAAAAVAPHMARLPAVQRALEVVARDPREVGVLSSEAFKTYLGEEAPFIVANLAEKGELRPEEALLGIAGGAAGELLMGGARGLLGRSIRPTAEAVIEDPRAFLREAVDRGGLEAVTPEEWGALAASVNKTGDVTVRDVVEEFAPDLLEAPAPAASGRRVAQTAFRSPDNEILHVPLDEPEMVPHVVTADRLGIDEDRLADMEAGFVDETGNFLTRDEARQLSGTEFGESTEIAGAQGRPIGEDVDARAAEFDKDAAAELRGEAPPEPEELPFIEGAGPEDVRPTDIREPRTPRAFSDLDADGRTAVRYYSEVFDNLDNESYWKDRALAEGHEGSWEELRDSHMVNALATIEERGIDERYIDELIEGIRPERPTVSTDLDADPMPHVPMPAEGEDLAVNMVRGGFYEVRSRDGKAWWIEKVTEGTNKGQWVTGLAGKAPDDVHRTLRDAKAAIAGFTRETMEAARPSSVSEILDELSQMVSDGARERTPGLGVVHNVRNGTVVGRPTGTDRMLADPKSDWGRRLYDSFEDVRSFLRERFGETVPLYRGTGPDEGMTVRGDDGTQIPKPTRYYGDRGLASEFVREGGKLVKEDVPVDRILYAGPGSMVSDGVEFVVLTDDIENILGRPLRSEPKAKPEPETVARNPGPETKPGQKVAANRYEGGFFDLNRVVRSAADRVRGLDTRKLLAPTDVENIRHDAKLSNKKIAAHNMRANQAIRDFRTALRQQFGLRESLSGGPKAFRRQVQEVLTGEAPYETLPEAFREPVRSMREQVDLLTRELQREGVVQGDLAAAFEDNLGIYLNRSYRVFDEPEKWVDNIPEDVWNRAVNWARQEFRYQYRLGDEINTSQIVSREVPSVDPKTGRELVDPATGEYVREERGLGRGWKARPLTESEIHEKLTELLTVKDSPIGFMAANSKIPGFSRDVLKHRRKVPSELRALWGEYEDAPLVNYTRTVNKMGNLLERWRLMDSLRQEYGDVLFHHRTRIIDGVKFSQEIGSTPSLGPLADKPFTTKEIAKIIDEAVSSPEDTSSWLHWYMRANAVPKVAKTVGSEVTQVRNVTSGIGFASLQGYPIEFIQNPGVVLGRLKRGVMTAAAGGAAPEAVFTTVPNVARKLVGLAETDGARAYREYFNDLLSLGVLDESAVAGDLAATIKEAFIGQLDEVGDPALVTGVKKPVSWAMDFYRMGDDLRKVFFYEMELDRYLTAYQKAGKSVDIETLKRQVAWNVRNIDPTYSEIPEIVNKVVRRSPLVGPFVSFSYEVARTGVNTLRLATEEMRDPVLRSVGQKRMVGIFGTMMAVPSLAFTTRWATGITREDEDDLRTFLPPWSKNSDLLWFSSPVNGHANYVDISYTDPHSYLRAPVTAMLTGGDVMDGLMAAVAEIAKPFIEPELLAANLDQLVHNEDEYGRPIYNPEDTQDEVLGAIVGHVWNIIEPGTISSLERLFDADKDPAKEIGTMLTGLRLTEVDINRQLPFVMGDLNDRMANAEDLFNRVAYDLDSSTEDLEEAYEKSERARRRVWNEMRKVVESARAMDVDERSISDGLRNVRGISKTEARNLLDGEYEPRTVSDDILSSVEERARNQAGSRAEAARVSREFAERRRRLRQLRNRNP